MQHSYGDFITLAQWFRRRQLLKQIIHEFLFLDLAAILFNGAERFSYFGGGSPKQHSYEV